MKLAALADKKQATLGQVRVLKRVDVTPDLMNVWIERPRGYTFRSGQYCTIGLDGIERAYSIVSAPHEEAFELFIELVPPPMGVLTPRLWRLEVGDRVTICPRAKGVFTFNPDLPVHLLLATVTGVVPYVSFLRDYLHSGQAGHHFYVLLGASYLEELAYQKELEGIASRRPEVLTFVSTISRPAEERNSRWRGETGRVNAIVERYVEKLGLSAGDTQTYACGHPGMIEDVKSKMIPRGFKVAEERYWKDD